MDMFLFDIHLRVAFLSHVVLLRQLLRNCFTTQLLSFTSPPTPRMAGGVRCLHIPAALVIVWLYLPPTLLGVKWHLTVFVR